MSTYPLDPALTEHIAELKEVCREIGAIEMHVIRLADQAWIYAQVGEQVEEIRLADVGLLFVARFRNTDGGKPGVENPTKGGEQHGVLPQPSRRPGGGVGRG